MSEERQIVRDNKGRFTTGTAGRPAGIKNKISRVVVDALEETTPEGKTNLASLVEVLLEEALVNKNMKAVEILLERGYGKSKEFVEISTPEIQIIDSLEGDEEEEEVYDSVGGSENTSS